MSKLARALVLGAMLAAMNLAGMTAIAQAQPNDDPDGKQTRRQATESQVGETWRKRPVTSQQQAAADAALQRQLARERFSIPAGRPPRRPPRRSLPSPADSPAGSSRCWLCWPLPWRCPVDWP